MVRGVLLPGGVDDPTSSERLAADGPVRAIRSCPEEDVVVMATSWMVLCSDRNGIRWRGHRPALEGVSLGEAFRKHSSHGGR